MEGNCGCSSRTAECAACPEDCGNLVPFSNLLNLPTNFCPGSSTGWQNLRISAQPYLQCILEPCVVKNAQLVYTDPCAETHEIENYRARAIRARVFGSIEYIISAQSTASEVSGETASVSDFYTVHVNRVLEFLNESDISKASVIVDVQSLAFDTPAEVVYGGNHALKIMGAFALNLGYVENGSFENDFSGWTLCVPPGATAATVGCFEDYQPVDGCYFALLKTDGPGAYNIIRQDFYANAGDTLSGWAFFKTNDYLPYNDRCDVSLLSGGNVLATLFEASVSSVGDYGHTPWTRWEYTFAQSGLYTLKAEITNVGDSANDSFLGLDAIKLCIARE